MRAHLLNMSHPNVLPDSGIKFRESLEYTHAMIVQINGVEASGIYAIDQKLALFEI